MNSDRADENRSTMGKTQVLRWPENAYIMMISDFIT